MANTQQGDTTMNPVLEEARKSHAKLREQYKDVIAAAEKMRSSLGNRRSYKDYTG
jgi:hypothetical protein